MSKSFLHNFNKLYINSLRTSTKSYRNYATRKRFYKNTGILKNEGKFEITLDQRKLKTPKGNLFVVDNEPLAIAVVQEWEAQKNNIIQTNMHITNLCNTVIDNPNNLTKYDMVNYIINYLETDTILYQVKENEELYKLQQTEWDPIIDWFNKTFHVNIEKSQEMESPKISEADRAVLTKYLSSHNFATIHGLVYGVDTLKSVILTLACVQRYLTCEKTVLLSRLEEEYQLGYWGRVEWAHDLSQQDLQARLAAVMLFVYFNSQSVKVQAKFGGTDLEDYINQKYSKYKLSKEHSFGAFVSAYNVLKLTAPIRYAISFAATQYILYLSKLYKKHIKKH